MASMPRKKPTSEPANLRRKAMFEAKPISAQLSGALATYRLDLSGNQLAA
jgi:hypothetical protein